MVENFKKEDFDRLKEEVERLVGRKIASPKDFDFLMRQIYGYTQELISVSTLKRMWGYVNSKSNPSKFNLDLLSRMVGFYDWDAFVGENSIASSRFFMKSRLIADALDVGSQVRLTWQPGRVITIKFMGNDNVMVMESQNSKLAAGDTFTCHQFVTDEPLYLSNLAHPGIPPCNYVAGQNGGIKWNVLEG